ncbi:MAG: hypothetical protein M3Y27_10640, partial [Acidobacteriota bacterium]|nr:hypothetical protein [Acidobacteriota bacterium]
LPSLWQLMNEGQHHVVFKGKSAIRRLHPIGAAYARYFRCEALLICTCPDVFNHGIAKDKIEGGIFERKQTAISGDQLYRIFRADESGGEVQNRQVRANACELPNLWRTADVQNARPFS